MKPLDLLGFKVKDRITGFKGIVTSISYDLYGCIQAIVRKDNSDSFWYDITRLKVISKKPVMKIPDFDKGYIANGEKGPESKPMM